MDIFDKLKNALAKGGVAGQKELLDLIKVKKRPKESTYRDAALAKLALELNKPDVALPLCIELWKWEKSANSDTGDVTKLQRKEERLESQFKKLGLLWTATPELNPDAAFAELHRRVIQCFGVWFLSE